MGSAIVISILLSIILSLCFFLEKILALQQMRRHIDRHDISNALAVAFGGLECEMTGAVKRALSDINGINKGYNDDRETMVNVGRLANTIGRVLQVAYRGPVVYVDPKTKSLVIPCVPSILSTALTNLIKNAMESCTNGKVFVTHQGYDLLIINEASERDCKVVEEKSGSSKGTDRGFGRQSTEMILAGLGIQLDYEIVDKKQVKAVVHLK